MTKEEVLAGSLWQVTVYAAFQRAKVYSDGATHTQKKGVKQTLEKEINNKLPSYVGTVAEKAHVDNIEAIAKKIDGLWASALSQGSIPIGVVQKAFNLYLKLMWCLGKIGEPPHCPVDKIIIDKLSHKHRTSWTRIRDIKTYNTLIIELKALADKKGMSLACWELDVYQKP